jgi:dephospho-CoA kinase
MKKIAITGNIGCGKSFVGSYLLSIGYPVIDSDKVVHELLSTDNPITQKIISLCQPFDITGTGETSFIDRKALSEVIFKDEKIKSKVEALIHPHCADRVKSFFEDNSASQFCFNLIPLLYEAGSQGRFDYSWLVWCKEDIRWERLKNRDSHISESQLMLRIKSQMPQEEKKKLADFIIDNSGSTNETKKQIDNLLNSLKGGLL